MGKGKKGERGKNENGEKGKREKGKRRKKGERVKGKNGKKVITKHYSQSVKLSLIITRVLSGITVRALIGNAKASSKYSGPSRTGLPRSSKITISTVCICTLGAKYNVFETGM